VRAAPQPVDPPMPAAVAPPAASSPAPVAPPSPAAPPQQKPVKQRRRGRRPYRRDDVIRASLDAFWKANRTAVDSAHS
jgi:hypothetical protein